MSNLVPVPKVKIYNLETPPEVDQKLTGSKNNQIFSVELRDPNDYFKTGDILLVFTSSEPVDDELHRVLEVENTMIQEAPHVVQYPAYDGTGLITVNLTTVVDPDGHLVEINHIMDGLDLDSN